mgnify:FL=1
MPQLIEFKGRQFSEEESKLVTDAYRRDIRGKRYSGERELIDLAKLLDIKVNIHYANQETSKITPLGPDENQVIGLSFVAETKVTTYGNDNSNVQIDLLVIGPHYEVLQPEGEILYKRVGIPTDGNCLYNSLIKATKGNSSIADKISDLKSDEAQFELEPNSPEVQGLRNYVADSYEENEMRERINESLSFQEDSSKLPTSFESLTAFEILGSKTLTVIDRIKSSYPDLETIQKTFVKLKNELESRQKYILLHPERFLPAISGDPQAPIIFDEIDPVYSKAKALFNRILAKYGDFEQLKNLEEIDNLYNEIQQDRKSVV